MRRLFTVFLVACGAGDDVFLPGDIPDATARDAGGFGDVSLPPIGDVGPPEPVFVGGPLACGKCTCDGTLYACLGAAAPDGGCYGGGGGPPIPTTNDAGDDAEAGADPDATAPKTCGNGLTCRQLPVECLPKPTCACITQATGLECTLDPNGNGFMLQCPPPAP